MAKIMIGVPIYHSSDILADFTKQTIESIKSFEHEILIYIVNNFSQTEHYPDRGKFNLDKSIVDFETLDNPKGNKVGLAWNLGIEHGINNGAEYVIVANNDLILHPKCI